MSSPPRAMTEPQSALRWTVYQRLEWQRPGSRSGIVISGTSSQRLHRAGPQNLQAFLRRWQCSGTRPNSWRNIISSLVQADGIGPARAGNRSILADHPGENRDRVKKRSSSAKAGSFAPRCGWRRKASVFSGFQTVALHDSELLGRQGSGREFRP